MIVSVCSAQITHPTITLMRKGKAMKALSFALLLMASVAFVLVGCSDNAMQPVSPTDQITQAPASLQKNIVRPFTGKEYPTALLSVGETFMADGKQIVKRFQCATRFEATFSDGLPDLLTGNGLLELQQVLDMETLTGHSTGKLTVTPDNPDADGVWEITWHSKVYPGPDPRIPPRAPFVLFYPAKWVGYGKGGAINGMQIFGDDIVKFNILDPTYLDWWGDGGQNCYVKEH